MEIIWTHTAPTSLAIPIKALKKYILVDTCSLKLIAELSIPVERTNMMVVRVGSILVGRFSMEVQRGTSSHTTHGNLFTTHVHLMTTNAWTPIMHSATM